MSVRPNELVETLLQRYRRSVVVGGSAGGPEWHEVVTELVRLRQEVADDREAMLQCEGELEAALAKGPDLVLAGIALHWWYTGLETLLERVSRALDGYPPDGPPDLLDRTATDLAGVRPAVLPKLLVSDLRELAAFRREFRQYYGETPASGRIDETNRCLHRLRPRVREALDRFDAFLGDTIAELLAA